MNINAFLAGYSNPLLRFRIDALPPTHTAQHKGAFVMGGKIRFFTKASVRREQANAVALILQHLPAGWTPPAEDAKLGVCIDLVFPYRASEPKRVKESGLEIPHGVRPDLDNLCKGLLDALVIAQAVREDSKFSTEVFTKSWGPQGHWDVRVWEDKR